ncbi:MAG: hypothetical protein R3F17_04880 [Planctomycetota bacterium]
MTLLSNSGAIEPLQDPKAFGDARSYSHFPYGERALEGGSNREPEWSPSEEVTPPEVRKSDWGWFDLDEISPLNCLAWSRTGGIEAGDPERGFLRLLWCPVQWCFDWNDEGGRRRSVTRPAGPIGLKVLGVSERGPGELWFVGLERAAQGHRLVADLWSFAEPHLQRVGDEYELSGGELRFVRRAFQSGVDSSLRFGLRAFPKLGQVDRWIVVGSNELSELDLDTGRSRPLAAVDRNIGGMPGLPELQAGWRAYMGVKDDPRWGYMYALAKSYEVLCYLPHERTLDRLYLLDKDRDGELDGTLHESWEEHCERRDAGSASGVDTP